MNAIVGLIVGFILGLVVAGVYFHLQKKKETQIKLSKSVSMPFALETFLIS